MRILNRSNVGGRGIASAAITHRIGDLPGDTDPAGLPRVARSSGYSGVLGLLLLALTFSGYYLGYQKGYTAGEQEMKTFLESAIPNLGEVVRRLPPEAAADGRMEASGLVSLRTERASSLLAQDQ